MRRRRRPRKELRLKLTIVTMLTIGILLLIGLSFSKYGSKIEGTIEYEPALFNTVLLGDLQFIKTGTGENTTVLETDGKLTASIDVTKAMEFGDAEGALQSDERRLRPGSVIAIPITITNGTSLGEKDADGTVTTVSNLAETEIAYTLNLITTTNIPLEYDVYEYTTEAQKTYMQNKSKTDTYNYENYIAETESLNSATVNDNWGRKLTTNELEITNSELIGYSQTHEVWPKDYNPDATPATGYQPNDKTKKFVLDIDKNAQGQEAISVHRYMLVVSWPDVQIDENGLTTEELRSTKYMKEIDIIEVRLEVESWVETESVGSNNTSHKDGTTSLIRLQASPVGNETYYALPTTGNVTASNTYGRFTVPFYATRNTSADANKSYLNFEVTNNTGALVAQWNEEQEKYVLSDGQLVSLSNGRVAIAVPKQETMGTVNDYETNFTYEINRTEDGQQVTYTGVLTGNYITTNIWSKNETEGTVAENVDKYGSKVENAYQIVEFKNASGEYLGLNDFEATQVSNQQLQLIVTKKDPSISYDNTDNFKILIYQGGSQSGN